MGGGAMLTQTAGSVVGGQPETFKTAATNLLPHHPSPSLLNLPPSANLTALFSPLVETCTKSMDSLGLRDERATGFDHYNVFGTVPSQIEVQKAISDLQRFMDRISTSQSASNGFHQLLGHYDPSIIQALEHRRIQEAFHMLQAEPSVQRMVISLSSDKAVWDAILNNKTVQNIQGLIYTAKVDRPQITTAEPDIVALILKWILGITKSKIGELIEKFRSLVNEIFQISEKEKPTSELTDLIEEKVRSSFLLSVVILLIVVVTRSHGV